MKFASYEEVDKEVMRLFNERHFYEAVDLLWTVIEHYPDNIYTITWNMAVIYSHMTPMQGEKIIEILENKKIIVDKAPFFRNNYESLILRKYFDFAIKEMDILKRRYLYG